jgi:hypothetical protein
MLRDERAFRLEMRDACPTYLDDHPIVHPRALLPVLGRPSAVETQEPTVDLHANELEELVHPITKRVKEADQAPCPRRVNQDWIGEDGYHPRNSEQKGEIKR